MTTDARFKLFISYSTNPDFALARRLESFLETFHRLPTPDGLTLQPLSVCRDGSDFHSTAGEAVTSTLEQYLERSDELLVLCSGRARTSKWVDEEVNWFLEHRGADRIRVAITEGAKLDRLTADVFPPVIVDANLNAGIVYDFRGVRGRQSDAWESVRPLEDEMVRLAADLYGRSLSALQPIWFAEQRKRWRRTLATAIGVAAALLALAVLAFWQRQVAMEQAENTRRQLYVSSMSLAQRAWSEGSLDVMRDALKRGAPGAGQADFRSFDWFHLARRAHAEVRRLNVAGVALGTVAISSDGTRIALAGRRWSEDEEPCRRVYVFSRNDGRLVQTLGGFSDGVQTVAFSPATSMLVAASGKEVRAWDGQSYAPLPAATSIPFGVEHLVFSQNGRRLALASNGGIRLVDDGFKEVARITVSGSELMERPALSPDGSSLVVGTSDGKVYSWRADQRQGVTLLGSHDGQVVDAKWLSGDIVVTGSTKDRTVALWSTTARKEVLRLQQSDPVRSLAVSPDGRTLAVGYGDPIDLDSGRGVALWDLPTRSEIAVLRGPARRVEDLAFTPDGAQLVGATEEEDAHVWQLATAFFRRTVPSLERAWMVDMTADAGSVAVATGDGKVAVWKPADGGLVRSSDSRGWRTEAVAIDPGGRWIASSGQDLKLTITDPSLQRPRVLELSTQLYTDLRVSPDASMLASTNCDGTLKLWRTSDWQAGEAWLGKGCLSFAAWSPDGKTIATGGGDPASPSTPATISLWSRHDRSVVRLDGPTSWPRSGAYAPDGRTLATGHWNGDVLVWSVVPEHPWWKFWVSSAPSLRWMLRGHRSLVTAVTFAPDGKVLASASIDGTVRFWDLETGQERSLLSDGPKEIYDLRFAPSGAMLLAAGSEPGLVAWLA